MQATSFLSFPLAHYTLNINRVLFSCISYYVRSIDSSPAQFYVPEVLDTLLRDMETVDGIVGKTAGDLPIWLGETSSASGGGAVELSDRFLAGFM